MKVYNILQPFTPLSLLLYVRMLKWGKSKFWWTFGQVTLLFVRLYHVCIAFSIKAVWISDWDPLSLFGVSWNLNFIDSLKVLKLSCFDILTDFSFLSLFLILETSGISSASHFLKYQLCLIHHYIISIEDYLETICFSYGQGLYLNVPLEGLIHMTCSKGCFV